MFKDLGIQIDSMLTKSTIDNVDLSLIVQLINEFSTKIILASDNEIDYGRYLAYKSENLNIQVDIFSENYKGQIHNHNTWGVIGIINGNFIIRDFTEIKGKLNNIRSILAVKGLVSYFPKSSDIHSLECLKGLQGVTIHIYGKGFDMDNGMRYIEKSNSWEKYKRSKLKDFNKIRANFKIKEN